MEDFDYSLEIADRDWECFLAECQECELLPPTLAVVDDSGLSEFDSTEFTLAQTVQKADPTADFTAVDHPVDSPPDCGGFPLENYLSKHDIIETDSVLAGSEEDLHLQCVNIFCEQLKNSTEAERFTEPIQERAGRNREAIQVEEHFGDGEQVSCIPVLNCLPANGVITDGKESSDPTDTISHENKQMKKDGSGSNRSPEPTLFYSLHTNKLSHPETKSIITSVANTERIVGGATVSQDPPDEVETTPRNEIVMNLHLDVVEHENLLRNKLNVHKKPSSDYLSNLEILKNVKWNENLNVSQLHATSTTQKRSPCQSPSVSLKRKNRKKRRLGAEPAESGHGYERGGLMKSSDSEEEQYRQKGRKGMCVSEDVRLFYLNDQLRQCVSSSTAYSESRHVPLKVATEEIKGNNLFLSEPACERKVRQEICGATGSPKDTATDSSGHVATSWQTDSKFLEGETNVLNKSLELPLSIAVSITGKSELTKETEKPGRNDTPAGSLSQSGETNHSVIRSENKQLSAVEVKSPTHSILSAESHDPTVEPGQRTKLYAEKSVLAEDAGNPGRDMNTRQAEKDPYTDQHRSPLEKTDFPLRANSMSGVQNTKVNHRKITACTYPEVSTLLDGAKPAFHNINLRSDEFCPHSLDVQTVQQTEEPAAPHTVSILDVSKKAKRQELASSQTTAVDNRSSSDVSEINLTVKSQREAKASISEDLLTNPSEGPPEFSCCTVDTPPATMRPCENAPLWIVTQNDSSGQGGKNPPIKHVEARSQSVSDDITDPKLDLTPETTAASKAEREPSFFAMSSFWSEMEKVTINDILALRKTGAAAPPSCSPPSEEDEQTDVLMDSEPITQPAESNPKVSDEYTCSDANSETCSSPVSSKGVLWESERVPVGPDADADTEDVMLSPVCDISQLVLPRGNQKQLKRICKSVSMRNLHVPVNSTHKPSNTLDKGEFEEVIYSPDGHMNKQEKNMDCLASSATDSYRISLTDIFNYLFAGKQTKPSPSAKENKTYCYTHGNSVSETYDYFFSEFNIESFFSPLMETDQGRDRLVFSSSHSDKRNLQFPEAYDYFFASSSSDDSSEECDEDEHRPVRVVNRFSRKSSTSNISTDIYEDFFTDSDLRQNFFWTNTLSFRKMNFIGSPVKTQSLSNLVGRSIKRMVIPANALGNQDVMSPDPLLHHLEDRISRQLDQQPFRYEDLETAISNPSLDIPLLPLRQSDMCLVCIVFASWVLKTANPQVGDAWKAVLLANVSALSSIRYLRKYINAEAAATERKLLFSNSSNS